MIVLGKKDLKNRKALKARKVYVQTLLGIGRPNASPSSDEWVSDEFYQGHRMLLVEEIREIDAVLRKLK